MREHVDPVLRQRAKTMRAALTEPERRLWWALRHRLALPDTHFRRQVVIGSAIADFACVASKLVVEVDGNQHGEDRALAYDEARTKALNAAGWRVLRFSNAQVMREMASVLDTILAAMEGRL